MPDLSHCRQVLSSLCVFSLASRCVKVALVLALPVFAEAWVGGRALAFFFFFLISPAHPFCFSFACGFRQVFRVSFARADADAGHWREWTRCPLTVGSVLALQLWIAFDEAAEMC
jgi:hypothetical protein